MNLLHAERIGLSEQPVRCDEEGWCVVLRNLLSGSSCRLRATGKIGEFTGDRSLLPKLRTSLAEACKAGTRDGWCSGSRERSSGYVVTAGRQARHIPGGIWETSRRIDRTRRAGVPPIFDATEEVSIFHFCERQRVAEWVGGRPHHDDTCSRVSPGHGPSSRGALGCIAIVVAHAPASAPGLVTGACSTPAGTACVSAVCRQIKLARAGELHDAVEGT
jgi:hypothetical protein